MSQITTHILDTSKGRPAQEIEVSLFFNENNDWRLISSGRTNQDGRIGDWLADEPLPAGQYRLHFAVQEYFERTGQESFYPHVEIVFKVSAGGEHYHVPLLLNPFGYSTYRGS